MPFTLNARHQHRRGVLGSCQIRCSDLHLPFQGQATKGQGHFCRDLVARQEVRDFLMPLMIRFVLTVFGSLEDLTDTIHQGIKRIPSGRHQVAGHHQALLFWGQLPDGLTCIGIDAMSLQKGLHCTTGVIWWRWRSGHSWNASKASQASSCSSFWTYSCHSCHGCLVQRRQALLQPFDARQQNRRGVRCSCDLTGHLLLLPQRQGMQSNSCSLIDFVPEHKVL
mmetsp:Transcript_25302/g.55201  ORF Transcript_25302/g.55201 Transcript_25302/m.55201 type:complete len:223 (-) Transcript_25302:137-805(-)